MLRKLCLLTLVAFVLQAADKLFNTALPTHYVSLATVPSSPTALYSQDVWLKSIILIPQSSSSPTCVIQNAGGDLVYPTITLTPNHNYRDEYSDTSPLLMAGGITWSCSDSTVKAQVMVKY